jgi:hypothetical protein
MDHQKLLLAPFSSKDLKSYSLEIIPDEYNSLVDFRGHWMSVMLDELKAAVLNHVE